MVIVGGGDGSCRRRSIIFLGKTRCLRSFRWARNSFARTLGVPLDLDGAIDVIANGRRKRIDLGCIDGDYFANAAAMGCRRLLPTQCRTISKNISACWLFDLGSAGRGQIRPFRLKSLMEDGSVEKGLGDRGQDRQRHPPRWSRAS